MPDRFPKWVKIGLGFMALAGFLAAGCANSQQEKIAKDRLELARTAYLEAKANRNVEAFAPLPFAEAGKALQAAEQAKNAVEMEQLSYVAEKRAKIAVAVAEGRMAERDADRLSKETADITAQKRTQEARIAQKEAENARLLAMAEAERATKAKKEAEEARSLAAAEAERAAKAKGEAEQARMAARAEAERAAKAKAEADQLTKELSDLKAKQTERGIILTLGDVLFATGKADLSPEAMRSVDKLVEFLKKYTNRNVLIEGHTDSVGSDEFNLTLSQKRADSLKEALTGKGIEERRITTVGYGKKYPVASNDTAAGKQQNRRVEVSILNEGVKPETQFRQ
ncbi:MAG TPA: OmpA family protein [Thermodesulfobacteriota bacterium]|nr:OmpA family protein [Thermodesulfobacteriota bacterium]